MFVFFHAVVCLFGNFCFLCVFGVCVFVFVLFCFVFFWGGGGGVGWLVFETSSDGLVSSTE